MSNLDIFVGHLAFEIGKAKMNDILIEKKALEKKYGEIYQTEVISTYYNEIGVIFSVEEADEDDALEYFEKQQAEVYGTFDLDEFNEKFKTLLTKKEQTSSSLIETLSLLENFEKEIKGFMKVYKTEDFTALEKQKTEEQFNVLSRISRDLQSIKRSINQLVK